MINAVRLVHYLQYLYKNLIRYHIRRVHPKMELI